MQSQSSPPLQRQRDLAGEVAVPRYKQLLDRLVPVLIDPAEPPLQVATHLLQVREQILTGLLRVGMVLGTLALLISIIPPLDDTPPTILAIDFGVI